ncbi:pantoate--beta-alanine ligase [Solimonas aquatica]|uniref:Pantothenate synthetase n=1 Tax=Solimonas aquatica TaxID=489703 RepID=A0A1H9D0J6_9GAMM|nr:pantoate--beta-alanine ligase [Solimonas aquatica]SEQ06909.1 pantoate--beta-alanine ligase [Solimonas aquatica]
MNTVHTVAELRATLAGWRRQGERIAFTPTMGNLHQGHLRLVEQARLRAARVVASVFVNPLQFGPNEDFDRYPRTLAADADKLAAAGCDLLFAPSVAEMYPQGREGLTTITVPRHASLLEGAFRPGHFDGVATVVNILFNQVQPDVALFGEKDYQQLQVIRQMVADLHLPIEIVGVATEREADGLAMSSRNQYLQPQERAQAALIHASLQAVAEALRAGRRDYEALCAEQAARLAQAGFRVQYLSLRASDLGAPASDARQLRVLVAAYLGNTRLIDNIAISL